MRHMVLAATALLAGCAKVAPNVDYAPLNEAMADPGVPYQLTTTRIVIGIASDPKPLTGGADDVPRPPVSLAPASVTCTGERCVDSDGKPASLAIVAVPMPDRDTGLLALRPRARRFVSTTIAPTYFPNTLRLMTLTVEAKDHRMEVIKTLGVIARGAAKLAGVAVQGANRLGTPVRLDLPVAIDLADTMSARRGFLQCAVKLPGNGERWTSSGQWLDTQETCFDGTGSPDVRTPAGLLPRTQAGLVHGAILTSACRPLRLTLAGANFVGGQPSGSASVTLDIAVADPRWLVAVPFPAKGTMVFHALCGADVKADAVAEVGVDELAQQFYTEVASLR